MNTVFCFFSPKFGSHEFSTVTKEQNLRNWLILACFECMTIHRVETKKMACEKLFGEYYEMFDQIWGQVF